MKRLALIAFSSVYLVACGSSTLAPSTPTPSPNVMPATTTGLTVTGLGCSGDVCQGQVGGSIQLGATAQLSDNTAKDVTSEAIWSTTNSSVAVVSASGLVSFKGSGDADVIAVFQGKSDGQTMRLIPAPSPPEPRLRMIYEFGSLTPPCPIQHAVDLFSIPINTAGRLEVAVEGWYTPYRDDHGDYLHVELLDGSNSVIDIRNCDPNASRAGAPCTSAAIPEIASANGIAGHSYTLKISSERSIVCGYRLAVTRPQ